MDNYGQRTDNKEQNVEVCTSLQQEMLYEPLHHHCFLSKN